MPMAFFTVFANAVIILIAGSAAMSIGRGLERMPIPETLLADIALSMGQVMMGWGIILFALIWRNMAVVPAPSGQITHPGKLEAARIAALAMTQASLRRFITDTVAPALLAGAGTAICFVALGMDASADTLLNRALLIGALTQLPISAVVLSAHAIRPAAPSDVDAATAYQQLLDSCGLAASDPLTLHPRSTFGGLRLRLWQESIQRKVIASLKREAQ